MSNSIWQTLSAIDCSAHVEKKGQFSYLAWTWSWAMVKENYPWAEYKLLDDTVYPDSTMEVRVEITIPVPDSTGHKLTHTMWLPVLDFKNEADKARMQDLKISARCWMIVDGNTRQMQYTAETYKVHQLITSISIIVQKYTCTYMYA